MSRIRIAVGSLAVTADHAVVDRTVDGVTYETVRGGGDVAVTGGGDLLIYDYEYPAGVPITYRVRVYSAADALLTTYSSVIDGDLDAVWLKSPTRPFLNRTVSVIGWSEVKRSARQGIFPVLGRRLPVAVTEVRGSQEFTLVLRAADRAEADALRLALSFGDVAFLHVPLDCEIPGSIYVAVGEVTERRPAAHDSPVRYFELDLTEVAAPDASVAGASITWTGVVSAYATWADLLAAKATWSDVLDTISAPADEVVG